MAIVETLQSHLGESERLIWDNIHACFVQAYDRVPCEDPEWEKVHYVDLKTDGKYLQRVYRWFDGPLTRRIEITFGGPARDGSCLEFKVNVFKRLPAENIPKEVQAQIPDKAPAVRTIWLPKNKILVDPHQKPFPEYVTMALTEAITLAKSVKEEELTEFGYLL